MKCFILLLYTMRESESKEKKFMSSKNVYFLPIINEVKVSSNKQSPNRDRASPNKLKSIQQIIQDKTTLVKPNQIPTYISVRKKVNSNQNLYNKYEFLPQILVKKNRKEPMNRQSLIQKSRVRNSSIEVPLESVSLDTSMNADKQNRVNFNSSFYRQHYNRKLEEEISKLSFNLKHSFSHNLLLASSIIDQKESEQEQRESQHYKYTKLKSIENKLQVNQKQLQKVPSFLLKILESQNPNTLEQ